MTDPSDAAPIHAALQAIKARTAVAETEQPSKPAEIWEYDSGQTIFAEGEESYELFMLMDGVVEVYVGEQKIAEIGGVGTYIGEGAALLKMPRNATVKALGSCKFLVFPDIRYLFEKDAEFGRKLSITLAKRLSQANERIEHVWQALHRANISPELIETVKSAFQGQ